MASKATRVLQSSKYLLLYSIILLFIIQISFADVFNTGADLTTLTTNQGLTNREHLGINFTIVSGKELISIIVDSSVNATHCFIYNKTIQIANSTFSGNNCTFNPTLKLKLGEYQATVGSVGKSYIRNWTDVPTYPYANDDITFTNGCGDLLTAAGGGVGECDNHESWFNIQGIYTGNITGPAPLDNIFNVTAIDNTFNGSSIPEFGIILTNTSESVKYETTTGNITLDISDGFFNITFFSDMSGGFHNKSYFNYNASMDLEGSLKKLFRLGVPMYSGFFNISTLNHTRQLFYEVNYTCADFGTTSITRKIDDFISGSPSITCDNTTKKFEGNFSVLDDNLFNITFKLGTTYLPSQNNVTKGPETFQADSNNPVIVDSEITVSSSFGINNATVNVVCNDSASPFINYNISINGNSLFVGDKLVNESFTSTSGVVNGINILDVTCSDSFGSTRSISNFSVFSTSLYLVNERTGELFDVSNLTSAIVYFDDNSSFFDFKGNNTNQVNFTSVGNDKLRFEFRTYDVFDVITRYVDISVLPSNGRICVNNEGVAHFEQFLISSSLTKKVIVSNVFADCVVAADTTRFAYQNGNLLKLFTIPSSYSIITFNSQNQQVTLAGLDGSISAETNIDILEFNAQSLSLSIIGDSMAFKKTGTQEITISYENLRDDNIGVNIDINRMDTNTKVFTSSNFADPNDLIIVFNYATLFNVTNETLFQIDVTKVNAGGESSFKRYFNTQGKTGFINAPIAFWVSFLLLVFGFTFTITRLSFSWFGLFVCIVCIAILSFAIGTWYTLLLQVITVIIMVYTVILMYIQNTATVA